MDKSTVYIDESGDLGKGKGTRWFVITAVIVKEEKQPEAEKVIRNIKSRLSIHEIHIRKITDFHCKLFIVKELNEADFAYANVIADTSKLNLPSDIAYNYMCRMLLERVSWILRDEGRTADIILSARGKRRDDELIEYISKLIPHRKNRIQKGVFGEVKAERANSLDLLQLADVCASTTFWAYEQNKWGMSEPCFLNTMKKHLYQYNGKINKYGIKYFPDEIEKEAEEIKNDLPCKEK